MSHARASLLRMQRAIGSERLVHIDRVATWPRDVRAYADRWAKRLRGSTRFAADLAVPLEEAEEFRQLLHGYRVHAVHCTRLLDHERTWILERGLRVASSGLVEERIRGALEAGAFGSQERDALLALVEVHRSRQRMREGQVCFIGSEKTLDRKPDDVSLLLGTWGGEILYMPLHRHQRKTLNSIGRPALVRVALDLALDPPPPLKHHFTPALNRLFVARRIGLVAECNFFYRASVAREHVLGIDQPGDPGYDRHRALPRA